MAVVEVVKAVARKVTTVQGGQSIEAADPRLYTELGVNSPRYATPIDDAPNLYPRLIELRTYERMIREDAQVRATLRACKIPVLGGEWYVDPASPSAVDQDAAEFVDWNLKNMSVTWSEVLENTLRCLDFGISALEKVFEYDRWAPGDKNRNTREVIRLKKLGYRPPVTIGQYLYDENGGPVGLFHISPIPYTSPGSMLGGSNTVWPTAADVWQPSQYPGWDSTGVQKAVFIPIEKLLIFTYDKFGGNIQGQSVLRTAYKHWYYKKQLYAIDAIAKERHAMGIPRVALPPGYKDSDLQFAGELARNIRTNEQGYVLQPPGWEIDFIEHKSGGVEDAMASALVHDNMIARNVLVQFINGTSGRSSSTAGSGGGGGSRGGAAAIEYDLFLKSLRSVANLVAGVFNAYLIPQLVDYNFDVKRYPELKVRKIGENRDLQMFATAIKNLVTANAISVDNNTELWIRNEMDMPLDVDWDQARLNQLLLAGNTMLTDDPTNSEASGTTTKQPTSASTVVAGTDLSSVGGEG